MELSLEDQIVAALRQIVRSIDLHSRRLYDAHGLTGPQLAVLQELARIHGASPSGVARAVHLSQATITGIVQRLVRHGLVLREPSSHDKRSVVLTVTDKGRAVLDASPSQLQDRFRESLSGLESWERQQILATLQRVASLMGADHLDIAPFLTRGDLAASDPAAASDDPATPPAGVSDSPFESLLDPPLTPEAP